MAKLIKNRRRSPAGRPGRSGYSITWDGPDLEQIGRDLIDEALRDGMIEAAQEAAAEEGLGDEWEIEVTLNVDDGRTVTGIVRKAAGSSPEFVEQADDASPAGSDPAI